MTTAEFKHGEMDISAQSATWRGFLTATQWGGFITLLIVAYLTFTLATGLNWLASLVIVAGIGVVGGLGMGMGGAWLATVIALAALAVVVQIVVGLASAVS